VELRNILKKEKVVLVELGVFFTYVRKLVDSVAETAFLGQSNSQHSLHNNIILSNLSNKQVPAKF
jgi:hypothetical protein